MTYLIILVALVLIFVFYYNRMVGLKNRVKDSWSNIDVALKRRYDLIPNMVNTVKGYAAHEQGTLEKVIAARNSAMSVKPGDIGGQIAADNQVTSALRQLFALSESYPDLKANTNFLDLQKTLQDIEGNLENARRYYNANVRENNAVVQGIPGVFIAKMFGFGEAEYYQVDEASKVNPTVQF